MEWRAAGNVLTSQKTYVCMYVYTYVYTYIHIYVHTCYVLIKSAHALYYVLAEVIASCFYVLISLLHVCMRARGLRHPLRVPREPPFATPLLR